MAEAGAVLAGGHTVEGQELLYGLAVTGTVHPDKIWRNAGAEPGDALVLTKPLGTGVVTTAAKADMVDPAHLSTALRWMACWATSPSTQCCTSPPSSRPASTCASQAASSATTSPAR